MSAGWNLASATERATQIAREHGLDEELTRAAHAMVAQCWLKGCETEDECMRYVREYLGVPDGPPVDPEVR
jgi:hypothetical protein